MCVVSVISDYASQWVPIPEWNPFVWDKYKKLKEAAKEFDDATKQPDCEDPKKTEFEKEVEEAVKKQLEEMAKKGTLIFVPNTVPISPPIQQPVIIPTITSPNTVPPYQPLIDPYKWTLPTQNPYQVYCGGK